ncbi:hypothetical protein MF271_18945 (plasmid) [Deinococcus sp. KNUC1210]|uniref:hypothetical protein n=1 Tax=Deinococcus sp. KNUC1210 TaxID=2917691 RepID=UPI001EF098BE|nr:hypothetical protein [Deinococcus sp. KNUC1210]ULH17399.1 hypothetical protein MF271_18945 [Deinococcus sp. KNUC1210]
MDITHKNIGDLDGGGIGYAIDQAIAEAMRDCTGRPGLDKDRKVIIQLSFKPGSAALQDNETGLNTIGIIATVKPVLPPRSGGENFLQVRVEHNANGDKVVRAAFPQAPLLSGGN